MNYFGHMHFSAAINTSEFRRFYDEPRCIISHNGSNDYLYVGHFCKRKKCTRPTHQCKDCPLCIKF